MTMMQKIEPSVMIAPVMAPTIFHEEWWLNLATNGHYRLAEVSNAGNLVGRLPYCMTRRLGMPWAALPPLTHFLGPAVDEGTGNIHTRFTNRLEITRALIQKLPDAKFLQIKCHRGINDVIPFQEQKFRTSVQFTHEIHPAPKNILWANLRNEKRRIVSQSLQNSTIFAMDDVAAFLHFYHANLEAKGIVNKLDLSACHRIIEACLTRQRGRILAIKDKNGQLQAAIFCPWDNVAVYYLMTTRAQSSSRGDVSALVWTAIEDAASRQLIFDFDGLSTEGSIMFYADFGGVIKPRYVATKMAKSVYLMRGLIRSSSEHQWFI